MIVTLLGSNQFSGGVTVVGHAKRDIIKHDVWFGLRLGAGWQEMHIHQTNRQSI